jgi:hypothetical protein
MSNTRIISKKIHSLTPRDKEYPHSLPVRGPYVVVRPDEKTSQTTYNGKGKIPPSPPNNNRN